MKLLAGDEFYHEKMRAQEVLRNVIDPELFVNIIDLGLIYEIDFLKENRIRVTMTLSTPHCPMGEAITNGVKNALNLEFPEREVEINLVFQPAWTFEMITEEGRIQLGIK